MAWLLIRKRDNKKGSSAGYKAGDVVEVRPEECGWGTVELDPLGPFYRVHVPDVSDAEVAAVKRLLEQPHHKPDAEGMADAARIRRRRFLVERLQAAHRVRLQGSGEIMLSRAQLAACLRDHDGRNVEIP